MLFKNTDISTEISYVLKKNSTTRIEKNTNISTNNHFTQLKDCTLSVSKSPAVVGPYD